MPKPDDLEYIGNTTKPGNPLWDEYRNKVTGKSTMEVHNLRKTSNWDKCKHQGFWRLLDPNGNIQCDNCGQGHRIVWGIEFCVDGKLTKNVPKTATP